MLYRIIYVFVYCNVDTILNKLYLSNYSTLLNNECIQDNPTFYYSVMNVHLFALCAYSLYIIKICMYYNSINNTSIALALVFIKYTLTALLNNTATISEYEFSRFTMWLFATPLMLKIYCDVNNLKIREMNVHYHVIPVAINLFMYPHRNTGMYYYYVACVSWLFLSVFIRTLYTKRNLPFASIYLFIWCMFALLTIVDMFHITDTYHINLYYSYADMISKMMTSVIVNDHNERECIQRTNTDLQSLQFISYMIKHITNYKNENAIITSHCNYFIDTTTKYFLVKIPENKTALEQELLRKILPFDFDKKYIASQSHVTDKMTTATSNANTKQFNMICVLFTDIVNYTELARKYDDNVIFQLLYSVYTSFDTIIKKYPHLQKIETIGDAYMVVGDIFRNTNNHTIVIKEIILFAMDIVAEIKTIKTPDSIPLSIRIGINMGNVSVGILGNEIPRLCVVGNSVNMASRLQSTAEIDTIQISRHIYEKIEEIDFDKPIEFITKENVFLKNIGSITTYNITPPPPTYIEVGNNLPEKHE